MSGYVVTALRLAIKRIAPDLPPSAALMICYAAGLLASRLMGVGAAGQPLFGLAAPVVLGLLIRQGASLTAADALRLAAVHIAGATAYGDPVGAWTTDLARNLIEIAFGGGVFARLRIAGFISSQVRVAAAVAIVSAAAATVVAPIDLLGLTAAATDAASMAARWLAVAVASALALWAVLTHDREDGLLPQAGLDEPRPAVWEYIVAALALATLVVAAVGQGRPEAALGVSVALLWFALRLGLFATSIAAFSFAAALLAFGAGGRWPAFVAGADPVDAELLRYLALALMSAPCIAVAATVHDQQRLKRMFAYRAMHDGLTELVNRSRFLEVLDAASEGARSRGRRFALMLIDLDHFKSVNDTFGHARGDSLLIEVSGRLRRSVRATDVVARIGGDEFAVVAPIRTVEDAMSLAKRLVETVNQPCDLNGVAYSPSITVGGVLSPDSAIEPQSLMIFADEALYLAKAAGRNCWRFTSETAEERPSPVWRAGEAQAAPETVYLD